MNLKSNLLPAFIKKRREAAFTLLELLVVVAIIGLLGSLALFLFRNVRTESRNSERISDVDQYVKAINMAVSGNGEYPDPGDAGTYCLGNYDDDLCGYGGTSFPESTALNNTLSPFIKLKTYTGDQGMVCGIPGEVGLGEICFQGYVYSCLERPNGFCQEFYISWFMEGGNVSCGMGKAQQELGPGSTITMCGYTSQ